jgi:PHP family Zn ribbon phosphoesterase
LGRVEDLADLPHERKPQMHPEFWHLIEFDKLIAASEGVNGRKAKAVERQYWEFVRAGGNELNILLNYEKQKLASFCPPIVVEAIMRMRVGQVQIEPGYDGEYGKIKIFTDAERKKLEQPKLF